VVRNTITASYSDVRGNAHAPVSASVDFSVTTVAATPTVLLLSASPGSTDGTGAQTSYTFRVRNNSNGPAAITVSAADGSPVNIALSGTSPSATLSGVYLGSTVIDPSDPLTPVTALPDGGSVSYSVPNDGGASTDTGSGTPAIGDGIINGLKANDLVYLYSGTGYYGPFTVTGVVDPAPGGGQTVTPGTITLKNSSGTPLTYVPAPGWQIVEAKDVVVTVTQGAVADATAAASWVTTTTATMAGAAGGSAAATTAAHMGHLAVAKYVRNVTTPASGAGSSGAIAINGGTFTYYSGAITGKPGEVLEYLVAIHNEGTGTSSSIVALDSIPYYSTLGTGSAYGSTGGGGIFARARLGATETDLKTDGTVGNGAVAYGASTGTGGGSTMSFRLGSGSSTASGGALASGQTLYLIYRIAVN